MTPFVEPLPAWVGGGAGDGHQDREAHFHCFSSLYQVPTAFTAGYRSGRHSGRQAIWWSLEHGDTSGGQGGCYTHGVVL